MDTKALRQKILDLAIRGKLVPQDPSDEPASVLLERIRQEKKKMVEEGKLKPKDIKKDTVIFKGEDNSHYEKFADGSVKCIEDEIPFEVPEGWEWRRLSMIGQTNIGLTYKPTDKTISGTMVLRSSNIIDGQIDLTDLVRVDCQIRENQYAQENDILICARNGSKALVGKCAIIPDLHERVSFGAFMAVYRTRFYRFIYYFLNSDFFREVFADGNSTTINQLTQDMIKNALVPFPPINEQNRICDILDKTFGLITQINLNNNLCADLIERAKSKILDLAIRGRLVPQDPNDEPASVLLERVRAEKEQLIKQGKIKRDKKESVIFKGGDNSYYEKIGSEVRCIDSEIPFELPNSWTFVRLKYIGEIIGGGTPDTKVTEFWGGNIPWVTPADFSGYEGMHISSGARTITEVGLKCSSAQMLPKNTVLYSSRAPIGYIAIAANPISTNQGFKSVVPYDFTMSSYLYYCLKARTPDIIRRATGTTFKEISGSEMAETIIPLPPINEQKQIFEKLTQLFNILSAIEKSLN